MTRAHLSVDKRTWCDQGSPRQEDSVDKRGHGVTRAHLSVDKRTWCDQGSPECRQEDMM